MMKLILFIICFLFSITSIAERICYVVGNGSSRGIQCANGFVPNSFVAIAPKINGEYIRDNEIVSIRTTQDQSGNDILEAYIDQTKVDAKAAAESAKATAETQKQSRKTTRVQAAKNAFDNYDTLTAAQKDAILKALLRDFLIRERQENE